MPETRGTRDIFIVCNNVNELGGLQQWAHHIGRLLGDRGHRVTLVGVTNATIPHRYTERPAYDVEVLHQQWHLPTMAWLPKRFRHYVNVRAHVRDHHRTAEMRRGADRLAELLRTARPGGVIIATQVWAMEWVRLALERDPGLRDRLGFRVIGMSHESYTATRGSSRHWRVKEFFADVDRLLVLTGEDADAWARAGMSNAGHMPNPLHVSPTLGPTLRERVVVCMARLAYEKGIDLALEAWAEVSPSHPLWRLRIYGSGPEEQALRRLAGELGIAGTVEFRGTTTDVVGALTQASIAAKPSREEGFPMTILESMACGLPTVAFDCAPGVRELLTHEVDGMIIPPGNTTMFAAALDRLIRDPDLRRAFSRAAQESVQRFHPDAVLDRWEDLFDLLHREPAFSQVT